MIEELTKDLIEETKKGLYEEQKINPLHEIFKIDEDELLDLIEEQNLNLKSDTSHEEEEKKRYDLFDVDGKHDSLLVNDELGFAKTLNKTLFEPS